MHRTPLLLSCILGCCLELGRLLVLPLVVGSSRLAVVVAILLALAIPRVVPLLATVVAGQCFHCHGDAATSDRPFCSVVTSPVVKK